MHETSQNVSNICSLITYLCQYNAYKVKISYYPKTANNNKLLPFSNKFFHKNLAKRFSFFHFTPEGLIIGFNVFGHNDHYSLQALNSIISPK